MIFSEEQINSTVALVKECGTFVAGAHNIEDAQSNITVKPGAANFVTVFDVAVQKKLIDGIKNIFPNAVFIAEENATFAEHAEKGLCFVIDPIDGTTNFIHDMHASAISVGAMLGGEPVLGIIYNPYADEMFVAQKGGGAFLNGKPIKCSERTMDKALVSFGTAPYNRFDYMDKTFSVAKQLFSVSADLRRSGSAAIDLSFVACGRSDVFFECVLSPWDYAAGCVIVTEAGGMLTDFLGAPVSFTKPSSVLCTNKTVFEQAVNITKKA